VSRTIEEILETAGVTIRSGKMECPSCGDKKLTASASKGVAKCWGCGRAWTERGDSRTPERDWAAYILTTVAEECQQELLINGGALDWLKSRGLPVDDLTWLEENDLGTLPGNLNLPSIKHHAKQLFDEWRADRHAEIETWKLQLKGPNKKSAVAKITAIGEEIIQEESNLANTLEKLPVLNFSEWDGSLVYVYRDAKGTPMSLNIRNWQEEDEARDKKIMRIQPRPNRRGLFGVTDAVYEPGAYWGKFGRTLVVEGEHNLLSLRAATRRWGLNYYLPAVAVGGKNGADIKALELLLDGSDPLVIYDNDSVDLATGMPGGYALVEAISEQLYTWVTCTEPEKDLDDYIVARPNLKPQDLYDDVIKPAEFLPVKYATIAARVQRHLEAKGLEKNERIRRVTRVIEEDVMKRTKLFNADGLAALLLPEGEVKAELVPAQATHPRFSTLMWLYGIFDREWIGIVASAISVRAAQTDIPQTRVHSLAHWSSDNHTLYLNMYDGSMIRMRVVGKNKSVVNAERVRVGTDGVLLLRSSSNAKFAPWTISDDKFGLIKPGSMQLSPDSIIDKMILSSVNYASDGDKYRQLLKAWYMALFFSGEMKSMPIAMMEGPGGGGKSSVGNGMGTMLMGPNFVVNNRPPPARRSPRRCPALPSLSGTSGTHPRRKWRTQ